MATLETQPPPDPAATDTRPRQGNPPPSTTGSPFPPPPCQGRFLEGELVWQGSSPPQLKPPAPRAHPGAGAAAGTSSHKRQRRGAANQTALLAPQGASALVPRCLTFRGFKIGYNPKQGDEGFVNAKLLRDFSHLPPSLPLTTALASPSSLSFLLLRTAHPPAPFQQQPSHFH